MKPNKPHDLWERLMLDDGCWLWTGPPASKRRPYGRMSIEGKTHFVHRLAYELTHGPIPPGKQVNHTCDRPMCCNPAHLYVGTQADNVQDQLDRGRFAKGNQYTNATHCIHGHEFTEENTVRFNGGQRGCRTCRVQRTREWRMRKKADHG